MREMTGKTAHLGDKIYPWKTFHKIKIEKIM